MLSKVILIPKYMFQALIYLNRVGMILLILVSHISYFNAFDHLHWYVCFYKGFGLFTFSVVGLNIKPVFIYCMCVLYWLIYGNFINVASIVESYLIVYIYYVCCLCMKKRRGTKHIQN